MIAKYVLMLYRKYLLDKRVGPDSVRLQAQRDYCAYNGLPHFAPDNGRCWSCGKQIYGAISLEKSATQLITGCPYCHHSYCE